MNLSLFIVVLGGRHLQSNIEIHDVRWVIGKSIEDTFPDLKKQWFGRERGLHIDSYKRVKYIDGYEIVISKCNKNKLIDTQKENESLWFINLGGYNPNKMNEEHEFSLVVAKKAMDARKKAKEKWESNFKKVHNDDHSHIKNVEQIDDIHSIKKIKNYCINLIYDPEKRNDKITPDWYGFMRIDKY